MVEWTDLPEGVLEDMKRYISYAWPPGHCPAAEPVLWSGFDPRGRYPYASPSEARIRIVRAIVPFGGGIRYRKQMRAALFI